jgi:hypothetical protein
VSRDEANGAGCARCRVLAELLDTRRQDGELLGPRPPDAEDRWVEGALQIRDPMPY